MGSACSAPKHSYRKPLREEIEGVSTTATLNVRDITMLMWRAKDLPYLVESLSELMTTQADEPEVFDQVEFYLPQLAHMILHLECDWPTSSLEHFALMLAQYSVHLALQLNWILVAAMEDYQPEDGEGRRNATGNAILYRRCATLMHNVEKAVVFGSPRSEALESLYSEGKLSKEEFKELEVADRRFMAAQLTESDSPVDEITCEGELMYKRWTRISRWQRKRWHSRVFKIQYRVLWCFKTNSDGGLELERAIPLHHTLVESKPHRSRKGNKTRQNYFELKELDRDRVYHLVAPDDATRSRWIRALRQATREPLPNHPTLISTDDLDDAQIARYGFFKSERDFVRRLTDICEEMREFAPADRKPELLARMQQLKVPGCVYLPMCKSTDRWLRVDRAIPEKAHPFSTKERCPCLMPFVCKAEGQRGVDVANYLFQALSPSDEKLDDDELDELLLENNISGTEALEKLEEQNQEILIKSSATTKRRRRGSSVLDLLPGRVRKRPSLWDSRRSKRGEGPSARKSYQAKAAKRRALHNLGDSAAANDAGDDEPAQDVERVVEPEDEDENEVSVLELMAPADDERVVRVICKSNDDLRQEVFTMQLLTFLNDSWIEAGLELYLKPYRILSTSKDTGILEVVECADTFDGIMKDLLEEWKPKQQQQQRPRLVHYFDKTFGESGPARDAAVDRYVRTLAGSSCAAYILAIKDRHNGNIMLNDSGEIAHIDFGFLFGQAPGRRKFWREDCSFERAAFKLTSQMVEIFGGLGSEQWERFVTLVAEGLRVARKQFETLRTLVEITGYKSNYPCFNEIGVSVESVIKNLKKRMLFGVSDKRLRSRVAYMSESALDAFGTRFYEKFQKLTNDYEMV